MRRNRHTCIQVFARSPRAGAVKTRLISALGAAGALQLHVRLLERTLATAHATGLPLELWLDGQGGRQAAAWVARYSCTLHRQCGGDLGARLHFAAMRALARGQRVMLLGADCITVSAHDLRRAAAALTAYDAVLAPAHDGGYTLLGLARPAPAVFRRIPWGTRHVYRLTRRRLQRSGVRVRELAWQHDVDRPRDLARPAVGARLSLIARSAGGGDCIRASIDP